MIEEKNEMAVSLGETSAKSWELMSFRPTRQELITLGLNHLERHFEALELAQEKEPNWGFRESIYSWERFLQIRAVVGKESIFEETLQQRRLVEDQKRLEMEFERMFLLRAGEKFLGLNPEYPRDMMLLDVKLDINRKVFVVEAEIGGPKHQIEYDVRADIRDSVNNFVERLDNFLKEWEEDTGISRSTKEAIIYSYGRTTFQGWKEMNRIAD